jgi:hypothetical protein
MPAMRWLVIVVLLAGCPRPPIPASTNQPPPKIAPAPPACVPVPEEVAPITSAAVDGSRVEYCVGDKPDQCYALDVASGGFEKLRERPLQAGDPTKPEQARVEMTTPKLEICQSQTCTSLTPKVLPNAATIRAATNAEGTIAVFLLGDAAAGKGFAEVWDVTKGKRTSTFRYARGDFKCGEVAILGEIVYIAASTCGAPSARGALFTLRGRRIANVGGKTDFGVYGRAFAQVDGNTWAFLEESGTKVAIQDVVKGKVEKTIDINALFRASNAEMGNPGESAIVRMGDGKLAIIAGAPATGSVATVDVTTGAINVVRAPSCN